ncbi:hypothetical protein TNCV_2343111 [Trichonephila clavipes]|nr:hypothetical protein TNCV_2343111 [Trichonephila clavipes]
MFQILLWSPWKYRCGQRTVRMAVMACSQNQAVFARRRSELKLKLELVEEKQKLLNIGEKERTREVREQAWDEKENGDCKTELAAGTIVEIEAGASFNH